MLKFIKSIFGGVEKQRWPTAAEIRAERAAKAARPPEKVIKTITVTPENGRQSLTGMDNGILAREEYGIEELDKKLETGGVVVVRVKPDVMTASFAMGMFGQSVLKFGLEEFEKKYKIHGSYYAMARSHSGFEYVEKYKDEFA